MKLIYYLLFTFLFCSSCLNYSYLSDFKIPESDDHIQKLTPITQHELFSTSSIKDDGDSYAEYYGPDKNRLVISRSFEKYVSQNLTNLHSNAHGYALLRINHLDVYDGHPIFRLISFYTLGFSNLVGVPSFKTTVELDISTEIIDANDVTIGIYNGSAKESAFIALYYGYSSKEAHQKSLYESIEICLDQINEAILRDYDRIKGSLERAGKLGSLE